MTAAYGFPYIVEKISDALVLRLTGTGITLADANAIGFGRDLLFEERSAPRVLVLPKGGPFGGRDAAHPSNVTAAKSQRPRASRLATGEVHCWGRTYEEAEVLLDQFCNAAMDVAVGQLQFSPASWNEETAVIVAGQEVVFGFSCIIPIVDGPVPFAPLGTTVQDEGHFITMNGHDTTAC